MEVPKAQRGQVSYDSLGTACSFAALGCSRFFKVYIVINRCVFWQFKGVFDSNFFFPSFAIQTGLRHVPNEVSSVFPLFQDVACSNRRDIFPALDEVV